MAALTKLTLIKDFQYRDLAGEQFSNTYCLRDQPPADSASWYVLATDIIGHEKALFPSTVRYVKAIGYNDDAKDAQAVWSHDFITAGDTIPGIGTFLGQAGAGDQAAFVWWKLDHKSTKGKSVYLRKYLHHPYVQAADPDHLDNGYITALQTFANDMAGAAPSVHGGIRARTGTWGVIDKNANPWVTTRTLKRRGKRPLAHP